MDINYIVITSGSHATEAMVIILVLMQKMHFVVKNFVMSKK